MSQDHTSAVYIGNLESKNKQLEQHNKELLTANAAMREALIANKQYAGFGDPPFVIVKAVTEKALSSTAGKEFLERINAAESQAKVCREDAEHNATRAEKAEQQITSLKQQVEELKMKHQFVSQANTMSKQQRDAAIAHADKLAESAEMRTWVRPVCVKDYHQWRKDNVK